MSILHIFHGVLHLHLIDINLFAHTLAPGVCVCVCGCVRVCVYMYKAYIRICCSVIDYLI